ncbi:MAG: hypothetical protein N2Z65_03575 [Clostridiales bacterium]|nr:hypothetical protein [Clostridiales bacterium]
MDLFFEKIEPLLKSSGLSDAEFEKQLGLPRSTVYDWRKKRSKSYWKHLPQIALKLGVSVGMLLSNEPLPNYLSEPPCQNETISHIPPELVKELENSKLELENLIKVKKKKLAELIEETDLSLSQMDIIERMIYYICKTQQK